MPVWAFIPLFLVALVACPVSMWVMSKVTGRKASCVACHDGSGTERRSTPEELESRKAGLEREIALVKTEISAAASTPHAARTTEER